MSEQAPPPPVAAHLPRRRTFLWVGLAVLIPVVAAMSITGLILQATGWRAYNEASSSMLPK